MACWRPGKTFHKGARPDEAGINEALLSGVPESRDFSRGEVQIHEILNNTATGREYAERVRKMRDILEELVNASVVFADERLDYVEIQVSKAALEDARKILSANTGQVNSHVCTEGWTGCTNPVVLERMRKLKELRQALELLYRVTCTNGADPNDVKPPVGRANWSASDRERALQLARQALAALDGGEKLPKEVTP